jgi:tRNA uridine 5-carbamoylmethylation protein Kti12
MLTVMFWKKAWAWLKSYWYFPIIFIMGVMLLLSGKGANNKVFKLLDSQKENYKKEIDAINKAAHQKDKKQKEIIEINQEKIKEIELKFDVKIEELESNKEQELKRTIKEFEDNPDELAKRIADILDAHLVER